MTKEIGRICYFEIVDRSRNGHIAVDRIVFSDSQEPPADPAVDSECSPACSRTLRRHTCWMHTRRAGPWLRHNFPNRHGA